MSKKLNKYKDFICNYSKLPCDIKKSVLKNIPNEFLDVICEISHNLNNFNIPINNKQKQKLSKYKYLIKILGDKKKKINKQKQKRIVQRGGGFLPLLFSLAAPIISNLFRKK